MSATEQRGYLETRFVGRKIEGILWDNTPIFSSPAQPEQIAGLHLEGGVVMAFSASPQIDVDRVFVEEGEL